MNEIERIRVGIVGAGQVVKRVHAPIASRVGDVEIQYIADVTRDCIPLARDYDTDPAVVSGPSDLPECDAAVLAIPLGVREPYLEELGSRNTPVFVEKPFAPDHETHRRYVANGDLFCDYMRTCYSTTQQLYRSVHSDLFGELESVAVREEGKVGATGLGTASYQTDPEMVGGGVLFERGCHTLSQLSLILDGYEATIERAEIDWVDDLDTEIDVDLEFHSGRDTVDVSYRHSRSRPIGNVTKAVFENCTLLADQTDPETRISILPNRCADSFSIDTDLSLSQQKHSSRRAGDLLNLSHLDEWATDVNQAWYIRWLQFVSFVRGNEAFQPTIRTGPDVTRIITEIYDEAR